MKSNLNQFIGYNTSNDADMCRRFAGFPLNSTLVTSYTQDTIRTIITHAAAGKPYTTAVWIRISAVGIQISAQDAQIARTRIPVFIPIALVHDIFMQSNINNVICIVYEEIKSNMKGVLLYVVHPTDAHLLREDFRIVKQSSYTKGIENQLAADRHLIQNNRLFSPTSQHINDIYLSGKINRQQSPKRILYVRDNDANLTKDTTPALPQLSYTPYKGSYHSSRENSCHRRNVSPRKNKSGTSASKPGSECGSKHRHNYRSRSPQRYNESPVTNTSKTPDISQEQVPENESAPSNVQKIPIAPMGIYNRYVPKAIPLPTGETIKTTLPTPNTNGVILGHIEPQQTTDVKTSVRSPSDFRSVSPKRQDSQQNRSLSAHNADTSTGTVQSSNHHHHHHHHHRRNHITSGKHSASKPDSNIYNTISHSFRTHSKYIPRTNKYNSSIDDDDIDTKQYLKQLINEMQSMKLEMNKIRLASASTSAAKVQADSYRVNIQELRNNLDVIRTRIAMTPNILKS